MESENYTGELPHKTLSVCPTCNKVIEARVFEKDGKVWISKKCKTHGIITEIYWEDAEMYEKARKYGYDGPGIDNPNVSVGCGICPMDCGLCDRHKSHTMLANIAVTNRCDLSCWYCFYYASKGDPIYEPSLEQIRKMLKALRNVKPVPANAIQLTGGEPTLRDDIVEIIEMAREEGFEHVQLNTHTIELSQNLELTKKVRKAGVNTIYMSFDGVSKKTNPKNHWEVPGTLENFRKADVGAVLVPTVIRGINDHELGAIINFGLNNIDVVRGVNFQPVSLVGRMPRKMREKQRITIPGAIEKIEEQTGGIISKEDFYPVPCMGSITNFVEALSNKREYSLSTHFACGAATYVFLDGDKVIPISRFVDVAGLFEFLNEKADEIRNGKNKLWTSLSVLRKLDRFIDKKKQPSNLKLRSILFKALINHDYTSLGEFHHKSMFIGFMHFMDLYNYDTERVQRCGVHYAMADGRIVPFCAFNVMPEIYRDKVQNQYSISWDEWRKKNPGSRGLDIKYRRDIKLLEATEAYKKTYGNMKNYWVI